MSKLEPGRSYSGQDLIDMGLTTEINAYAIPIGGKKNAITVEIIDGVLSDAEEQSLIGAIDTYVQSAMARRRLEKRL